MGKANKYHFIFIGRGDSAEKGSFASDSNFKYCIQTVKLLWPTQNLLWPSNIPSVCCRPYKRDVPPPPLFSISRWRGSSKTESFKIRCQLGCSNTYLDLEHGSANFLRQRAQFLIVGLLANHTGKVAQWYS